MQLFVGSDGNVRCLYGEELDLRKLGSISLRRASHVEPDESGQWWVDLTPVRGRELGPFECRSSALASEVNWLEQHRLGQDDPFGAKEGGCES